MTSTCFVNFLWKIERGTSSLFGENIRIFSSLWKRKKRDSALCVFVSSGGSWSKRKIKCCLVLLFLAYLQQLVRLLWGLILSLFLALQLQQFGRFWSSTIGWR